MSTTKNNVIKFNNQIQQEKSKLNDTLQNLNKFEAISKSLLDVSGENDYVKELDKFFYGNTEINVVQLFLSNRYQAAFMFALKFFIEIYKVNNFQTRNHYFQHLEDEMVAYLKLQNKNNQFILESCLWLKAQIKQFKGVVSGCFDNVSSFPLLNDLESYFQKS
jgi:hypothetical protein